MIKERMTPEELALLTGYSRQTINKWVRKEGWITSPKPGVQGGKARLVHVNEKVRDFIRSARRATETPELPDTYHEGSLHALLLTLANEMTPEEQKADDIAVTAGRDYRLVTTFRDSRPTLI